MRPATLLVHYQVPLVDNNDVYIESKDGTYSNDTYSTQNGTRTNTAGMATRW